MASRPCSLSAIDPRVYWETLNELHSYITSSTRGFLTQAELFRYYRQRHENTEIPYRLLGYRSLLDLLSSDNRLFAIDLRREPASVYSAVKLRQQQELEQHRRRGTHTISRQHHSTNALGEHHTPDYPFHRLDNEPCAPLEESQLINEERQSPIIENIPVPTPNGWHTPPLDEQMPLTPPSTEEILIPEPITVQSPQSPVCLSPSPVKFKPIQRRTFSPDNDERCQELSAFKLLPPGQRRLNRSISTSTTNLSTSLENSDFCIFVLSLMFSLCFVGAVLYKIFS